MYWRLLVGEFGESTYAMRKKLNDLTGVGFLIKLTEKNKIEYNVNTLFPYFANVQYINRKCIGLEQLVATVLVRLGKVSSVVLLTDCAMGEDYGKIIIDIFGQNLNVDYLKTRILKIETIIYKQVDFSIKTGYPDPKGLILY